MADKKEIKVVDAIDLPHNKKEKERQAKEKAKKEAKEEK